jgi:hypothetical protein
LAVALGGILRDIVVAMPGSQGFRPEAPYTPVFSLELALLIGALVAIFLLRRKQASLPRPNPILIGRIDRTCPPRPWTDRPRRGGLTEAKPMTTAARRLCDITGFLPRPGTASGETVWGMPLNSAAARAAGPQRYSVEAP